MGDKDKNVIYLCARLYLHFALAQNAKRKKTKINKTRGCVFLLSVKLMRGVSSRI